MKMEEILKKAAGILCLDIVVTANGTVEKKLLSCANSVFQELTTEYIHLKDRATLTFEGGRAYYTTFPHQVRDVISVRVNGEKAKFSLYPQYLFSEGLEGNAEVLYVFREGDKIATDEVLLPPQFSAEVVATGTAAEYCYRSGLIDEGIFYKNRYDQTVYNLSRSLKQVTLPGRRFV